MGLVGDALDAGARLVQNTRQRAEVGKHLYLSGIFEPVNAEVHAEVAAVSGQVPAELRGFFARVGPNPRFPPAGQYHLFDGDGYVVGCKFSDSGVSFTTAWVRTERFLVEDKAGRAVCLKLGDLHGTAGLAIMALDGVKNALGAGCDSPMGTANTALEFHAGRLLALNEGDVPWSLRVLCEGALETMGAVKFGGKLGTRTFTAHPKVDASTGELLYFGYQVDKQPFLTYGVIDASGQVVHSTPVPLRFGQMMHDFSITEHHAIFWDLPLEFSPMVMVSEDKLPFVYNKAKGARFGLLPRRACGESVRWFDLPGCMIFHSLGAWEEEDGQRVRLFACRLEDFSLDLAPASGSQAPRTVDAGSPTLFEFVFNLQTGEATQSCVVPLPLGCTGMDFPRAHPALVGRRIRYGWLSLFAGIEITGVAKVDLETRQIVGRINFPPGASGSEILFVPRREGAPAPGKEDDGFLLTYVSMPAASALWIMDAHTMAVQPLAVVDLPQRVPYGFHATYVTTAQLATQQAPQ